MYPVLHVQSIDRSIMLCVNVSLPMPRDTPSVSSAAQVPQRFSFILAIFAWGAFPYGNLRLTLYPLRVVEVVERLPNCDWTGDDGDASTM